MRLVTGDVDMIIRTTNNILYLRAILEYENNFATNQHREVCRTGHACAAKLRTPMPGNAENTGKGK
jgi:hypothetical protein